MYTPNKHSHFDSWSSAEISFNPPKHTLQISWRSVILWAWCSDIRGIRVLRNLWETGFKSVSWVWKKAQPCCRLHSLSFWIAWKSASLYCKIHVFQLFYKMQDQYPRWRRLNGNSCFHSSTTKRLCATQGWISAAIAISHLRGIHQCCSRARDPIVLMIEDDVEFTPDAETGFIGTAIALQKLEEQETKDVDVVWCTHSTHALSHLKRVVSAWPY